MIKILADSTCDLPADIIQKYNICIIPLHLSIGQDTYTDGVDITTAELLNRMKNEKVFPQTSLISPGEFVSIFDKLTENGDELLVITLSSKMSGTYNSAVVAKGLLPERTIDIIDSKNFTIGLGYIVLESAKMVQEGRSKEEILLRIEYLMEHLQCVYALDTLEYLHRGGRISKAQYVAGNILGLKIILEVNNGELKALGKTRGNNSGLKFIADYLKENIPSSNQMIFMYTDAIEYADKLRTKVTELYPDTIHNTYSVGCTIACYAGNKAFGVCYEK